MNMATISKHALVDDALYRGFSIRAEEARWDAAHGRFRYRRNMGGFVFTDYYAHPEDEPDRRFSFVPQRRVVR
jgi:hypothetical protein